VTTYSFEQHKKTSQIRVLDIQSGDSTLVVDDLGASEPIWLSDNEFLYLKGGDKGSTILMAQNASYPGSGYKVATVAGAFGNLKATKLPNGNIALAGSASATPDGRLANPETETKPYTSAKIYTSLFVRHWDTWKTENRNAIWYSALEKRNDRYVLASKGFVNALAGTKLESPVPPFGGTADFDIGPAGLVFVAKDPELDPAIYTKTDLYYVPLTNFTEEKAPSPKIIKTPGLEGYTQSPVFSHSGRKVAFTRMRSKQYESDKTRLHVLPDIGDLAKLPQEFFATKDGKGAWDYRPDAILWSADDSELFVTAEKEARNRLWVIPSDPAKATKLPTEVKTTDGSVSEIHQLAEGSSKLLVTSTSLIDNSAYSVVDAKAGKFEVVSSTSNEGRSFGLSRSSVSDFWYKGDGGKYDVHALVMKPSDFDPKKKYPLAFLIHGGPQGAWTDGWSTRWNPAIFAEQGYVVVAPNPTGSSGYGMALQDGITGEWGGRPYKDLEKAFEYVEKKMPYVDTNRAVALGASYGGYMINWIQGHPLGRKFKALVCHDGVYSLLDQWATEELFFPIHDFEGTIYDNREGYEKWDPARFLNNWSTPELIIHSELDYRLPVTEGLAAFNVLQAKKVPSKLLVFPDENHWVLKPENSLVWHREVLGWINKYSGIEKDQRSNQAAKRDVEGARSMGVEEGVETTLRC